MGTSVIVERAFINPYLYYAFNNESRMVKFQAIICHRSFVEFKMLGLRYVAGATPGKSLKRKTKESEGFEMAFRQLLKSPYQYFKNRNGIFRKLKLNLQ
jgi:hypothetical protein